MTYNRAGTWRKNRFNSFFIPLLPQALSCKHLLVPEAMLPRTTLNDGLLMPHIRSSRWVRLSD